MTGQPWWINLETAIRLLRTRSRYWLAAPDEVTGDDGKVRCEV
jgi:hypothetical protein